mmetsp:Transcript_12331/g.47540  ORF Transcript_12331/g.47540 Transcript_12331/m.47540 type:complete len:205 (+) Transcript_12331:404-1018(+)
MRGEGGPGSSAASAPVQVLLRRHHAPVRGSASIGGTRGRSRSRSRDGRRGGAGAVAAQGLAGGPSRDVHGGRCGPHAEPAELRLPLCLALLLGRFEAGHGSLLCRDVGLGVGNGHEGDACAHHESRARRRVEHGPGRAGRGVEARPKRERRLGEVARGPEGEGHVAGGRLRSGRQRRHRQREIDADAAAVLGATRERAVHQHGA